nr:hypothetical protein [Vibrio cholerae]
MLINGQDNDFVRLASRLGMEIELSGEELIFESREACIGHHDFNANE